MTTAPLLIFSVIDIVNFYFVLHCETTNKRVKDDKPKVNKKEKKDKDGKTFEEALNEELPNTAGRTER